MLKQVSGLPGVVGVTGPYEDRLAVSANGTIARQRRTRPARQVPPRTVTRPGSPRPQSNTFNPTALLIADGNEAVAPLRPHRPHGSRVFAVRKRRTRELALSHAPLTHPAARACLGKAARHRPA
ncbi:hypothetical protein [Streptomyces acidiscabies]|uniref:Uncharacterized protein n=1 Tax=Streptomyces acidiscabies TaxID=42234 RepID=A0A0L0K412_9ACTN|nr:hypothetical protein [Streptomyces acidiscabies]KND32837.1 hypothetical protein IQ63_22070 [Streptomyces acidiscabies]